MMKELNKTIVKGGKKAVGWIPGNKKRELMQSRFFEKTV